MDEKNVDYLAGQVKGLGFRDKKEDEIKTALQSGVKKFWIKQEGEFKRPDGKSDKMEYVLHFDKSETSDKYFLNRMDAILQKNEERPENLEKTFFVMGYLKEFPDAKLNITSLEAYNLLSGRAVLKDRIKTDKDSKVSEQYLDFSEKDHRNQPKSSQYHGNYYDLNEVIKAYPIKGKENQQVMDDLFYNLEKDNLTQTTFIVDGKDQTKYVTAKPVYKNLEVYDENFVKEFQGRQHRESRTRNKGKEEEKVNQEETESKKKDRKYIDE